MLPKPMTQATWHLLARAHKIHVSASRVLAGTHTLPASGSAIHVHTGLIDHCTCACTPTCTCVRALVQYSHLHTCTVLTSTALTSCKHSLHPHERSMQHSRAAYKCTRASASRRARMRWLITPIHTHIVLPLAMYTCTAVSTRASTSERSTSAHKYATHTHEDFVSTHE